MAYPQPSMEPEEKGINAFRTISEVAEMLGIPAYVLRFWETKFPEIKPLKHRGGRRYYRPEDVDVLQQIKHLLYEKGYTIKGARAALRMSEEAPSGAMPAKFSAPVGAQLELLGSGPYLSAEARATLKEALGELEKLQEHLAILDSSVDFPKNTR